MSSSVDPFSNGSTVLHYRLLERVGNTVWRAEDTRSGKDVALKVLTKQLPKDAARRESTVREVRLAAAIHHTFVVPIIEIVVAGDSLLMLMEKFDGQSITKRVSGKPLDRTAFFRIAYQIAEALKILHGKGMIHGNVNGDSVLVSANGQVRIGGLNLLNLLQKKDGAAVVFQQKGSDLKSVSYMAPEQIAKGPVDTHTDIFAAGAVLYEMATGRMPYAGGNAGEVARAIVEGQPASPKAANPNIDNAVMMVLGRCLFKDPFRRYKDASAMAADIATFDPTAAKFASELTTKPAAAAPAQKTAAQRHSILLLADLANYDELTASDPRAATRAAARVQQGIGEAVYLFDGTIVDPFGPLVVAEMPSVQNAIEAARKGEFDFSPEQQGDEALPVRLLLHSGDVETRDGSVVGDAVSKAAQILADIPPYKLHLTEQFLKEGKISAPVRDAGAKSGVKLHTIGFDKKPAAIEMSTGDFERFRTDTQARPAAAPPRKSAPAAVPVDDEQGVADEPVAVRARRPLPLPLIGGIAAALLIVIAGAVFLLKKRSAPETPQPQAVQAAVVKSPVQQTVADRTVTIQPFTIETPDAALTARGDAIRLATIELLKYQPHIKVTDAGGAVFAGTLRKGAAGPEFVPMATTPAPLNGTPSPVPDAATGVQALFVFISAQLGSQLDAVNAPPEAINAFGDALTNGDATKAQTAMRNAAKAAPSFIPIQLAAMTFFDSRGDDKDALEAAKQIAALQPNNLDAVRRVARAALKSATPADSISAYTTILKSNPRDAEALNVIGEYTLAAGDEPRFRATLAKLARVPAAEVAVHEPDLLVANGFQIDTAISKYYDIEVNEPNNPALCLKIGRISVLRRSMPIAELELKKLQDNDPDYGLHILKAYIAAQQNNRAEADAQLKAAQPAAKPWSDFWTTSAEIYAMFGDNKAVIAALQQVADRGEPTVTYILTHPLFAYLRSDADFIQVRLRLLSNREAMRAALAQIPM